MDTTRVFVDHPAFDRVHHERELVGFAEPSLWVPDDGLLRQMRGQKCPLCHAALTRIVWHRDAHLQVADEISYESLVCNPCGYWTWTRLFEGNGQNQSTIVTSLVRSFQIDDKALPAAFISDWLKTHDADRYHVHPRSLELVVRDVLKEHLDCELTLTKETRDGGIDLHGFDSRAGRFIVEVKRFGRQRPVGVSIVRQLAGVLLRENLGRALLISTSGFSRQAQSEADILRADTQKYPVDIEMLDVADLLSWLNVKDTRSQFASTEEYWRHHVEEAIGSEFVHREDVERQAAVERARALEFYERSIEEHRRSRMK